jgi:hypothetical protein
MEDEALHTRAAPCSSQGWLLPGARSSCLADADIKVLRDKHLFLCDFSDAFIRNNSIGDLMKIESTAMKARELERVKDADDRLAMSKIAPANTFTTVGAGLDNCWNTLCEGRFLRGATCSTAKLWLTAKQHMGSSYEQYGSSISMLRICV